MSEGGRGFLYFLPGGPAVTRKRVEDAGLGYLFDGRRGPGPSHVGLEPGPGGKPGCAFSVAGRSGRGGPLPSRASETKPGEDGKREPVVAWSPIHGTEAWIGVLEDALPGPADLARAEAIEGHQVELGDGASWLVPVVRRLRGDPGLPCALVFDGHDWNRGDVKPAFRALWAAACRIWAVFQGARVGEPVTLTEEATTAATAIAVNYRVSPVEVGALGLLDTGSHVELLKAVVDWPSLKLLEGKEEAATPS